MTLDYQYIENIQDLADQISKCEGVHTQQAVYSTFHGALTQVCYGCLKVRSTIYRDESEATPSNPDNTELDEIIKNINIFPDIPLEKRENLAIQAIQSLITSKVKQAEIKARINEAKRMTARMQIPNHIRSARNSNTSRKRGIVSYFNKVMATRRTNRLATLQSKPGRSE